MQSLSIHELARPIRRLSPRLACLVLAIGVLGPKVEAQALNPRREQGNGGFGPAPPKASLIDRTRPFLPEGVAMVAEILAGGSLAPDRGWFDKGTSKTRFDWKSVATPLDRDGDGKIARGEFPGADGDFRRLDRDKTGKLTPSDFSFPSAAVMPRSRMILGFADRNQDGKIIGVEYSQMMYQATRDNFTRYQYFADAVDPLTTAYRESERKGSPFLSLGDLREAVDQSADRQGLRPMANPDGGLEVAGRSTLLKALIRRDIGSLHAGPSVGEPAPDFTLPSVEEGQGPVALAKLLGRKPVVLAFGSSTDGAFRADLGTLEKLQTNYRDRAEFLMIYVRESRPSDGWEWKGNVKARIAIPQPKDEAGRLKVARDLKKKVGLGWPMAVDRLDDRVGILYSGMPDRLYLLDASGQVAYKSGRGPFGFKPDELEQSLILLLQAEPVAPSKPAEPDGRQASPR